MNQELEEKHNQAMALAEQADAARHRRDLPQARQFIQEAFLLEKAVALQYAELPDAPSAGEPREAERLIARALAGDPPPSLAEELRELWDQVRPQLRALQVA